MIRIYLPIPQKIYNITKRLKILQEIEQYFPGFLSFIDSREQQQIPRPTYKERRKMYYSLGKYHYMIILLSFTNVYRHSNNENS